MSLDSLLARAGTWHGPSLLQDPERGIAEECASTASVTPLLRGRFARVDYTWSYRGAPQEGSILVAHDPATTACELHWIDSWHMSHAVMVCRGEITPSALSARGAYAAPPGPDWGWRIDLVYGAAHEFGITMFNVSPEGTEYLAVTATYTPD